MMARADSTRLSDPHDVGGADRRPNLFAGGIAGDGDVAFGAARLNADVEPCQLRIELGVALGARPKGGDALVSECLAHVGFAFG